MKTDLRFQDETCGCIEPYIIKKPGIRTVIEGFFSIKRYTESSWICMNCKWESEKIRIRTN